MSSSSVARSPGASPDPHAPTPKVPRPVRTRRPPVVAKVALEPGADLAVRGRQRVQQFVIGGVERVPPLAVQQQHAQRVIGRARRRAAHARDRARRLCAATPRACAGVRARSAPSCQRSARSGPGSCAACASSPSSCRFSAPSGRATTAAGRWPACARGLRRVARSQPSRGALDELARQRHGLRDAGLEGLGAVLAHVGVGVVLGRQEQEADRPRVARMRQAGLERAARGSPAGGVAVEAEDHRVGEAKQLLHVIGRAGRAERGDGIAEARAAPAPRRPCSPRRRARSRAGAAPPGLRTGRRARGPC